MSAERIKELQRKLELSTEVEVIRRNKMLIKELFDQIQSEEKAVIGLMRANRAMCDHRNKINEGYDPREGSYWECADCGASH